MSYMFAKCHKLKEIKGINKFNIIKVANKKGIFDFCYELKINKNLSKINSDNFMINNNTTEIINKLKEEKEKLQKEIDNMFAINFESTNQNIKCPMVCKKTDNFKTLEEKLYRDYPELKNKNLVFMANGNVINRDETLDNNGIKSGNAILICEND